MLPGDGLKEGDKTTHNETGLRAAPARLPARVGIAHPLYSNRAHTAPPPHPAPHWPAAHPERAPGLAARICAPSALLLRAGAGRPPLERNAISRAPHKLPDIPGRAHRRARR